MSFVRETLVDLRLLKDYLNQNIQITKIHSAGTKPEINVNPYAIRAMKDANIDISNNYPKLVDDFVDQEFDYVLTVCDSANEICPTFHNAKNKIHNSFEDPSKDSYESDEHAMEIYNQTVKDISNWIEQLDF